jgi:C1A family cysteine protease
MPSPFDMEQEDEFQEHSMGYVPSKKDLRDYKLNKKVCHAQILPEEFIVEHSSIKNQGAVGSCVAHSVSEVLEAISDRTYSTGWIYGYRPAGYYQGEGMMTSNALKTVHKVGSVYQSEFPINVEMPKAKELVTADLPRLKQLAAKDKIYSYARLYSIQDIKEAIYKTKTPVVVCIPCNGGIKLDDLYIAEIPDTIQLSGHAVVCYGWNRFGLLIQNSWGVTWGDNGCFILPYEYPISESWVMTKDPDITIKPSAFALREVLVTIGKLIVKFIKGLFNKN